MSKPYAITSTDYVHARNYLLGRVSEIKQRAEVPSDAEYLFLSMAGTKEAKAKQLHAWCVELLTEDEWLKMRAAIRKSRQRAKGDRVNVVVTSQVKEKLEKLAKREGKATLSEVIEMLLRHM